MITIGFSVLDIKAGAFITPFFMQNQMMAVRLFKDCANDPAHMFCRHPDDYALYQVCEFDDASGAITPQEPLEYVGVAKQFKQQQEIPVESIVPAKVTTSHEK